MTESYEFCENCLMSRKRYAQASIDVATFAICASLSGFLYLRVIISLKNMRQNNRVKILSRAFAILWVTWVLLVGATPIFNVYMTKHITQYNENYAIGPSDFSVFASQRGHIWRHVKNKILVNLEVIFMSTKHSYAFVNSILLIVLLRPFRQPIHSVMLWFRTKVIHFRSHS